ncbi:hypothetical protein ACSMXN_03980 [Jatrophihabitans sp. DSM 45814]
MTAAPTLGFTADLLGLSLTVHAPRSLGSRMLHEFEALLPAAKVTRDDVRLGQIHSLVFGDDGRLAGSTLPPGGEDPILVALAELTGYVVTRSPLLCIHAGVVTGRDGAVVLPGVSGHGKTTLTAAMTQAGFGYLSDEVLAIDRTTLALTPFPRPLAVDSRSWQLLGFKADEGPTPDREALLPPAAIGQVGNPARVTDIVLAQRIDIDCSLERVSRGAAVRELLVNSFNHYQDGHNSFEVAVETVRSARVWRLAYRDAPLAASRLALSLL